MRDTNEKATEPTQDLESSKQVPFKTFESEEKLSEYLSDNLKSHEEKLKAKLEAEIKSKLEKEANFTAEQKLTEKIKELENEKKAVLIDKNRTKAEREFVSKNLSLEGHAEILDYIVSEDESVTLDKTGKLLKFIEANSQKIADEKIKKAMKDVSMPKQSEAKGENTNENIAKNLGKSRADTYKSALETIQKYL
jgi:hypothetical protein